MITQSAFNPVFQDLAVSVGTGFFNTSKCHLSLMNQKNETSLRADVEKQLGSFSEGAFLITC